jgi:hypothetical protein
MEAPRHNPRLAEVQVRPRDEEWDQHRAVRNLLQEV